MIDSPGSGFAAVVDYGQHGYCTCPTVWMGIYPPPLCDYCKAQRAACAPWQPVAVPLQPVYPFAPVPQRLSDEDVERIAKRVAEILTGPSAS